MPKRRGAIAAPPVMTMGSDRRRRPTERHTLVSRVKALAEALEGSDVSELDLTEDGLRILIKRQVEPLMAPPAHLPRPPRAAAYRRLPAAHADGASGPEPRHEPGIAIVAPLTGVFYNAPSPTSAPFAAVGDPVQAGQVICIIEAMKVFNEIRAEVSGSVVAIVPKNGQLVQKGEALIRVQTS
jgi:acetyl-CoA carboxylase biotin carboxyl carrier protein